MILMEKKNTIKQRSLSFLLAAERSSRVSRAISTRAVPGYDCDFEKDLCGWTQGSGATLDWFREQSAANPLAGIIGPLTDHTYGNSTGYYVTTRLQFPITNTQDLDISILVSPRLPSQQTGPMCADWWYMMHGTSATEMSLILIRNEDFVTSRASWRRYGDQGRHWQHAQIQIEPNMNVTRVVYEVVSIFSVRSEVSLDDLVLIDGPCIQPDFYSMECTFEEEHICGYYSDPLASFAWFWQKGATPTALTGAPEGKILIQSKTYNK